jgi:peptidoglycan/LPS O-acetylase OafA/YrhL
MGLFSYYLIEKPCLKLKDRFHKPKRSKPGRQASPVAV